MLILVQGKNESEASSSGLKLKVNRFFNPNVAENIDMVNEGELNHDLTLVENSEPVICGKGINLNRPAIIAMLKKGENLALSQQFSNPWMSTARMKVNPQFTSIEMSDDGIAIKLNEDLANANALILKNSLVVKVLGNNIPIPVCC
ncbi:hypothetical protein MA16_Dca013870 [Dendrobium catenatum]|uniref:Uncharacterized protein n=1 Tax=Dendrobium catenatum TaxID=906689 RepID=A0A2I0WCM9_9ASPA|nr:hypothetical protein MA16_Dca013870 [Dendrobium catenatum]